MCCTHLSKVDASEGLHGGREGAHEVCELACDLIRGRPASTQQHNLLSARKRGGNFSRNLDNTEQGSANSTRLQNTNQSKVYHCTSTGQSIESELVETNKAKGVSRGHAYESTTDLWKGVEDEGSDGSIAVVLVC